MYSEIHKYQMYSCMSSDNVCLLITTMIKIGDILPSRRDTLYPSPGALPPKAAVVEITLFCLLLTLIQMES